MLNGILLIDKPKRLTSYKVVEKIVRKFRIKKAGHLGTLDPLATGLLPICLNEATKIVRFLINGDKEYEGTLLLGVVTDTGDMEGKLIKEDRNFELTEAQIRSALKKFTGTYLQTPPMYSAVKQDGKKLYKLAREGKKVERKKRKVTISSLEMVSFTMLERKPHQGFLKGFTSPKLRFRVACSKGTYIRSLANDIGEELGCGATLSELRRTRVGQFSIQDAKPLEEILKEESIENYLIDVKTALRELPNLTIKNSFVETILSGTPIYKEAISNRDFKLDKEFMVKVSSEDGQLLCIAKCIRGEKDFEKLAPNGIVFNHIRVFSTSM
jgi:tRNA pseudouridine55 synthase